MARVKAKTTADNSVDVAVLKTQMENVQTDVSEIKDSVAKLLERFEEVSNDMTKYKGMVGGLLLAGSLIFSFVTLLKGSIIAWFASPKA